MNGQTKYYDIIQKEVDEFVKFNDLYEGGRAWPNVNLRAYSSYLHENNLSKEAITPELVEKFVIK